MFDSPFEESLNPVPCLSGDLLTGERSDGLDGLPIRLKEWHTIAAIVKMRVPDRTCLRIERFRQTVDDKGRHSSAIHPGSSSGIGRTENVPLASLIH
jgi:hypothetical protein